MLTDQSESVTLFHAWMGSANLNTFDFICVLCFMKCDNVCPIPESIDAWLSFFCGISEGKLVTRCNHHYYLAKWHLPASLENARARRNWNERRVCVASAEI